MGKYIDSVREKSNITYSKYWVDIMFVIFTLVATFLTYYFDVFKLNICIEQEAIVIAIYLIFVFLVWIIGVPIVHLLCIFIKGEDIEFITDERVPIGVKTEKIDNEIWLLKSIRLKIGNNGNEQIENCHASLEDIKRIAFKNNKFSYLEIDEFERNKIKGIEPRLKWISENVSDGNCNLTIDKKSSKSMIEIAAYRFPFKNMFIEQTKKGDIGFYYCGFDLPNFIVPIGLYSLRIRIDGKNREREFTKYFNGYLSINIETYPDGQMLTTKFREGNPIKDKDLIKELKTKND